MIFGVWKHRLERALLPDGRKMDKVYKYRLIATDTRRGECIRKAAHYLQRYYGVGKESRKYLSECIFGTREQLEPEVGTKIKWEERS